MVKKRVSELEGNNALPASNVESDIESGKGDEKVDETQRADAVEADIEIEGTIENIQNVKRGLEMPAAPSLKSIKEKTWL